MIPATKTLATCAVVCASLCLGATTTSATPRLGVNVPLRWSGNFDPGTFQQWAHRSFVPGGAKIVHSVRREGRYAARFIVRPGDRPVGVGERSEVGASVADTAGYRNLSPYYGWSTFFPRDFNPIRNTWNIFAQWHSTLRSNGCGGPPNVAFHARLLNGWTRPRYEIRVSGGDPVKGCRNVRVHVFRLGAIRLDRWNDFVLRARWSPSRHVGYIEAWINGRQVVPLTHMATMYRGYDVHLQQGLYRGPGLHTTKVFQDAMRRGPTYRSVDPRRAEGAAHPKPR